MEKSYYNVGTLEHMLMVFERRYDLTSAEFFARHIAGEPLEEVSGFHRHTWASFYRDFRRLSADRPFVENAERLLAQPV